MEAEPSPKEVLKAFWLQSENVHLKKRQDSVCVQSWITMIKMLCCSHILLFWCQNLCALNVNWILD